MEEEFRDQLSRVELMSTGESATWDLSDNDTAALAAVLADRQRMAAKLNARPILSKYHGARGFEVERFIADYEAWTSSRVQQLSDILNDRRPAALAQTPEEFMAAVRRMADEGDEDAMEYLREQRSIG